MAFRKIRITMRILLIVVAFVSIISTQTMQNPKNRGCTNQVISVLSYFFEYTGQESLHRYRHRPYHQQLLIAQAQKLKKT